MLEYVARDTILKMANKIRGNPGVVIQTSKYRNKSLLIYLFLKISWIQKLSHCMSCLIFAAIRPLTQSVAYLTFSGVSEFMHVLSRRETV